MAAIREVQGAGPEALAVTEGGEVATVAMEATAVAMAGREETAVASAEVVAVEAEVGSVEVAVVVEAARAVAAMEATGSTRTDCVQREAHERWSARRNNAIGHGRHVSHAQRRSRRSDRN